MTVWTTWREDAGGAVGVAALALTAWLGVVHPTSRASAEADRLQIETDLLRSQVAMVQTQLRNVKADLEAMGGAPPSAPALRPKEEFNRVLASLNQAAVAAQITLDRALPGAAEHLPEVSRYRLSLSGQGTYAGAVRFLRTLRDEFPDVTVTVVSALATREEGASGAILSFELAWHAQAERDASPLP